jgi:hypothetical protein
MIDRNLTKQEHVQKHKELHAALDELMADFMRHDPTCLPSYVTVLELMEWSALQCKWETIQEKE